MAIVTAKQCLCYKVQSPGTCFCCLLFFGCSFILMKCYCIHRQSYSPCGTIFYLVFPALVADGKISHGWLADNCCISVLIYHTASFTAAFHHDWYHWGMQPLSILATCLNHCTHMLLSVAIVDRNLKYCRTSAGYFVLPLDYFVKATKMEGISSLCFNNYHHKRMYNGENLF